MSVSVGGRRELCVCASKRVDCEAEGENIHTCKDITERSVDLIGV